MKKIICVFILLGIFTGAAFSQVEAESLCAGTPLECTVELLKAENDLSHRDDELTRVSNDLWYSGRKREAVQIIDLFDEDDGRDKLMLLIDYAEKSLQEGDIDKAADLLVRAFEFREDFDDLDDFIIKTFAFSLVAAGQEAKIGELLESIESEHEKVLSLIEFSKSFWKKGDYLKTMEMLSEAAKRAEKIGIEYRKNEAKAEIGRLYIEIGELKNGSELIESVKYYAVEDTDVFRSIFAAYLKAGEYEKALDLVNEIPDFTKSEAAYHSAEIYFHAGQREQSLKLLKQTANYEKEIAADPVKGFYYSFLVDVVKLYLKWNEPALALAMTKAFEDEKAQLFSLIEISKYYRNQAKPSEAAKIIELAFDRAKKIKNNDDRSQEVRDEHLAFLADECIDAKNFVLAEKIVRAVEKKYFRGGGLAVLVFKNKNYSRTKIWSMLDEAQILFQKNDSTYKPLDHIRLWSILAHGYAHNGKKAQAQAVFAEVLSYIADDDEINDSGKIQHLSTAGFWFEKSELTVDENIRKSLQKIAVRWIAENPPEEN